MPQYQHSAQYNPATSWLRFPETERYEDGFYIGSMGENGEHMRDCSGWPYSIYRKAAQDGVTDMVICHGIQNYDDAVQIAERLQCLA